MTLLKYRDIPLRQSSLDTIGRIIQLTEQYQAQGLRLTVRQIHYQFVARGWLPNNGRTYGHVQGCVNSGRLAGLISWDAIEDRGRALRGLSHDTSPQASFRHALSAYRLDKWQGQPFRPEVWVEKQALEGVIEGICNELQVDFYSCKGYNSQSEQWRAGQRFARRIRDGQRPIVFHLGDHDPSGLDMTRDNRERLSEFAGVPVMVQRLALNYDQVEEYRPPENWAKTTDVRIAGYEDYMRSMGADPTVSWELDALEPTVIRDLISSAVLSIRDESLWDAALLEETEHRDYMQSIIDEMGAE